MSGIRISPDDPDRILWPDDEPRPCAGCKRLSVTVRVRVGTKGTPPLCNACFDPDVGKRRLTA